MKTFKRMYPRREHHHASQQCSKKVDTKLWSDSYVKRRAKKLNDMGWAVGCCNRGASYKIGGKPYCSQHAGEIALKELET